jgi:hypothetical protein
MGASKIFSKFAKLLDRSTVDLPAINTPLADALAAKAASADLADVATSGAYADLSGTPASVSTVAELTDATTYDFPTLNTPVADALAAKADSADLGTIAAFEGDQPLRTTDPATFTDLTASGTVTASGLLSAGAGKIQITNSGLGMVSSSATNPSWWLGVQGASVMELSRPTSTSVQLRNHRDGDILLTSAGGSVTIGAGGNLTASGTVTAAGATFSGLVSQTGLGGSTYFGEGAGIADDLSANNNVGVGFQSLAANTTGFNNNASGYLSLYKNTTGYSNTASGSSSLRNNTTGRDNTANGNSALYSNTTGFENTASGQLALYVNTTGYYNTASGNRVLFSNTTGFNNTASGVAALYSNTTGFNNTASGYLAGRYITDGTTANATSSTSIYLGAETKALANGDTNEIVIGYAAIGAGSNTATLGNESITKTVLRGDVETDGTVTAGAYNVATLPLTPSTGMRAYVTNSSVAASGNFGSAVIAAGLSDPQYIVPVFYDGTNWIIA